MKFYQKILLLYFIYFFFIVIIIEVFRDIKNPFLLSFTMTLAIILGYLVYNFIFKEKLQFIKEKTSVRYTMHCKNCGWEWMSNTSEKVPSLCPNCRTKDKSEIIGWRKVKISAQKQKEKDLRRFFKV